MSSFRDDTRKLAWLHALGSLSFAGPPERPYPQKHGLFPNGEVALWRASSTRDFSDTPVSRAVVSQVLGVSYGCAASGRRNVPSAGGIYGLRLFVAGLENDAAFEFLPNGALTEIPAIPREPLSSAIFNQLSGSPAMIAISADLARYSYRYGLRGYRYLLLEAGHLAQQMLSVACDVKLVGCPLGAFDDCAVQSLFNQELSGLCFVYLLAIGKTP